MKKKDVDSMAAEEMKLLRWSCGLTRRDKVKNETIRTRLKVAPMHDKLVENRLRWFGHIHRRESDHICKRIQNWTVDGKRPRGRPHKKWSNCIADDLKLKNVSADVALDRNDWKKAIHYADPNGLA